MTSIGFDLALSAATRLADIVAIDGRPGLAWLIDWIIS